MAPRDRLLRTTRYPLGREGPTRFRTVPERRSRENLMDLTGPKQT